MALEGKVRRSTESLGAVVWRWSDLRCESFQQMELPTSPPLTPLTANGTVCFGFHGSEQFVIIACRVALGFVLLTSCLWGCMYKQPAAADRHLHTLTFIICGGAGSSSHRVSAHSAVCTVRVCELQHDDRCERERNKNIKHEVAAQRKLPEITSKLS